VQNKVNKPKQGRPGLSKVEPESSRVIINPSHF